MVAMEKCEPKYEPRCRIFFAEGQKFRTNLLVLFFDLPLKRETATKTALLAEVLRQGEDPTGAARQAELLFGAHWDISVVKKGGRQLLLFSLETTEKCGNRGMLAFCESGCLAPMQNGFTEKTVERQKKILRQKLENQRMIKRHLRADEPGGNRKGNSTCDFGGRLCGGFGGNQCRGAACILSGASGNGKGEGLFLRRKG